VRFLATEIRGIERAADPHVMGKAALAARIDAHRRGTRGERRVCLDRLGGDPLGTELTLNDTAPHVVATDRRGEPDRLDENVSGAGAADAAADWRMRHDGASE
jgi:hypothetical protein